MKNNDTNKNMLGLAFLYTVFTGTISLLNRLTGYIIQGDYEKSIQSVDAL